MRGFALGLVKGLTGGFTRNIALEQEARGADDARVAALEDTIIKASTDPKKRVPLALGNMLKDAQSQLEKRGPINIFGQEGPRLKLDMDKIAGLMNEVDKDEQKFLDYGSSKHGTFKIPISSEYFEQKTGAYDKADIWWKTMDNWVTMNPEKVISMNKHLAENTLFKNRYSADYVANFRDYKYGDINNINLKNKTGVALLKDPSDFKNAFGAFKNIIDDSKPSDNELTLQGAENLLFGKTDKIGRRDKLANLNKTNSIILIDNDRNAGVFTFKNVENYKSLQRLAKANGYNNPSLFVLDYRDQIQRGLKMGRQPDLAYMDEDDMIVDYEDARNKYVDLFHALEVEKRGGGLDLSNMSDQEKVDVYDYLQKAYQNNTSGMVRAFAPLMQLTDDESELFRNEAGVISITQKQKDDIIKKYLGVPSISEFNDRFNAVKSAKRRIDRLLTLEYDTQTSSGVVRFISNGITKITGPTGTISQIANTIFSRGDNRNKVSRESIEKILNKLKGEGLFENFKGSLLKDSVNIAEIESIAIILAADMARAVDPSGRLSNQDFEVQLRRLGQSGFFGSKIGDITALKTVKRDFDELFEKRKMIAAVLKDAEQDTLTPRHLQIIKANEKLNDINQEFYTIGDTPTVTENLTIDMKDSSGRSRMIEIRPGVYRDRLTKKSYQVQPDGKSLKLLTKS